MKNTKKASKFVRVGQIVCGVLIVLLIASFMNKGEDKTEANNSNIPEYKVLQIKGEDITYIDVETTSDDKGGIKSFNRKII